VIITIIGAISYFLGSFETSSTSDLAILFIGLNSVLILPWGFFMYHHILEAKRRGDGVMKYLYFYESLRMTDPKVFQEISAQKKMGLSFKLLAITYIFYAVLVIKLLIK